MVEFNLFRLKVLNMYALLKGKKIMINMCDINFHVILL